jgi:radical SAM protein with 4Fe4S-binding SPASM domain
MNTNTRKFLVGDPSTSMPTPEMLRRLPTSPTLDQETLDAMDHMVRSMDETGFLPFPWTLQEHAYVSGHHDDAALRDYLVYRYKMRVYPATKRVASFPTYVLVEPVSACNLRCVMCFQVDKTFTRKPHMGVMDFDLYRRVIDELAAGGTKAMTMASRGEPLLHPRRGEMVTHASGKFIDLKLNTNATKLTERLCHELLATELTELVFSIEAEHAELYEKIRVGGKFTEVLRNIERFRDIRERHYPRSDVVTTASGVFFRDDQDAQKFADFWSQRVDHVATVECEARWDTYNNVPHPDRSHPCDYLWERMYIWWDGKVNPCDVDYKSELSLGDVTTTSISDVWHSDAYTRMRTAHLAGARATYMPCDRCGI